MYISSISNNVVNNNKVNFKSVVVTDFVQNRVLPNQSANYKRILTKVKKDLANTKKWDLCLRGAGEHQGYFGNKEDIDVLITNREYLKSPKAYCSYLVTHDALKSQDKNEIRLSAIWTGLPRINTPEFKNISDIVLVFKNEQIASKHFNEISKLTENYLKTNKTGLHEQCQQIRENELKHTTAIAKAFEEAKEVIDMGNAYSLYRSAKQ